MTDLHRKLPVFHQPWWLDAVCNNWGVCIATHNDAVTGILPYSVEKKGLLTIIRNPLLTPYLGPIITDNPNTSFKRINREEQIFEELWQQLPAYDCCTIETVPDFSSFTLFHNKGFSNSCRLTYHIDLSEDQQDIFDKIQGTHRKRIEQARSIYTIREGITSLPKLIDLHRRTFERKGARYIYSSELLNTIISQSLACNQGTILAAVNKDGDIHGTVFICWDQYNMYLLLSAADVEKSHKGVICLLIWEAILLAKKMGLQIFDFEGSMDKGIEPFFRRFGGERKTYLSFEHNRSLIWKIKKGLFS